MSQSKPSTAQIVRSNVTIHNVSLAATIVGFSLCLGGIAASIAMDSLAHTDAGVEFWHWQRYFINPIINSVIQPGVWLFLFGNIGLFLTSTHRKNVISILRIVLPVVIILNVLVFLNPYVDTVNHLNAQQYQAGAISDEFTSKKTTEDMFGALNLFILIGYSATFLIKPSHSKPTSSRKATS